MEEEKNSYSKPIVLLVIVALVVVAGLIYVGQKYAVPSGSDTVVGERVPLTEAEKAAVLDSLRLPPGASRLSQDQKHKILESLRMPPNQKPLTPEEKAGILESLR